MNKTTIFSFIAFFAVLLIIGSIIPSTKAQDYYYEPKPLVLLYKRYMVPSSNPPQWATEPLYIRLENIVSMTPATGPNSGHTTVTISNGPSQSTYSIVAEGHINNLFTRWAEAEKAEVHEFN